MIAVKFRYRKNKRRITRADITCSRESGLSAFAYIPRDTGKVEKTER